MRAWSRLLAAGASVAVAVALAGCGSSAGNDTASSGKADKVKVGVIPIVDVAPIYLGKQKGFFTAEHIDLSLETGQGGAAIVPGVASGQFQFGFSNNTSLLVAASKGLPIKVVAAGNSTTGKVGADFSAVVVPKGSAIKKPSDLAGKTVAVNTLNNIGSTTIDKVVRDDGGDPKTIKYVELGFPDMPGALAKGQVDAAWVVEPFVSITEAQGATPVAWNFAGTDPNLMIASYFTSAKTASSDPDLVKRFTAAMNKSLDYANSHPDEVRSVLSSYTQVDAATASKLTLPKWSSQIDVHSFDLLADLAVQDGALEKKPDIAALLP
jgi:NitT/TauT family transport system substrate-binding protein